MRKKEWIQEELWSAEPTKPTWDDIPMENRERIILLLVEIFKNMESELWEDESHHE